MRSFYDISLEKGTDKAALHGYHPWYEAHFSAIREKPMSILEIGVQTGASLRLWEEYFPASKIYGIDQDPSCKAHESERSKVFTGLQEDEGFLSRVTSETGPLDIVIDDGGHHMWQQIRSLKALFPRLKSGGTYVIEDLETSYHPAFDGGLPGKQGTAIDLAKSLIDDLNGRYHRQPPVLPTPVSQIHFYRNIVFIVRAD